MSYKYIITRTSKSTIEVKPEDIDPETIDFLEKCMSGEIGFLAEEEETGGDWMNKELDELVDLNYDIKKVKI